MQKTKKPEIYDDDDDQDEIDLENDTHGSEDEGEDDVKPAKTKRKAARGAKGKKKGTAQKK